MGETHGTTRHERGRRQALNRPNSDWEAEVERLFVEHFDALCQSARRLLDTAAAAEDAVQEAFIKYLGTGRRPAPGCEVAYLRSIVLNEARSVLRHRQVGVRYRQQLLAPDAIDTTWRSTEARHESERLDRALKGLPPRQREVVTMRHLLGLSERETAHALRISPGSVKTHSSRGLSSIRRHLSDAA